jgi:hypothetical protein
MAFSLVASTHKQSVDGTTSVTTTGIDTTGAKLLVVTVMANGGGTYAVSDSKGNGYIGRVKRSVGAQQCREFFCTAPVVGASHTVTVTNSNAFPYVTFSSWTATGLIVPEFENAGTTGNATTVNSGSLTPVASNRLILAGFGEDAAITGLSVSGGSLAIVHQQAGSGSNRGGALAYEVQTTASSRTATWTWTNGAAAIALISSYVEGQTMRLVQGTGAQFTSGQLSRSLAFAVNVTAGNVLVVGAGKFNNNANEITTVADSQINAYTLRIIEDFGANPGKAHAGLWTAVAGSSGACTVTVTMTDTDFVSIGLAEIQISTPSYAPTSSASGTQTNPISLPSLTTATPSLLFCFYDQSTGVAEFVAAGATGWVMVAQNGSASNEPFAFACRAPIVAGVNTVTIDTLGGSQTVAVALAIQGAAAPAGGTSTFSVGGLGIGFAGTAARPYRVGVGPTYRKGS